jgi:O-succinylbenzoic acid--CoA ligase
LRSAALAAPEAAALVGARGATSYRELDRMVSAAAPPLGDLESGSRVALYLQRDERYVALVLALIRAGHVACPVSDRLPPRGVAPLLERAACSALISEDEALLQTAGTDILKRGPEDLLREGGLRAEPTDIPLERPATIIFTSGSTGVPKAALHTFGNHYYSALGSNANIDLRPGDRWLHSLPEPGTTPAEAIAGLGATHVSLVSTQLSRLLRESADLGGLEAVLMGGGPVPTSLIDEALSRGLPVHTSYGLTEMASQVTTTPPGASPEELRTAGRVLPNREVSISEEGEILVRGATLFAGYADGRELDLPLDAEGWFHTRDLGELDENGFLRVRGRIDNLFISGGENIQPEEIEEALCRLERIDEAVVVPVSDEEFGARPVAFVRTDSRVRNLSKELEPVLPRFKIPISFHPWPESEQRDIKVDRAALLERARRLRDEG